MTEPGGSGADDAETQRIVIERPLIDVTAAKGGWADPWPNVAELASVLPHHQWTLIGGLMTQMHAIHRGVDAVRPTNDVDIVLHIETGRGVPVATAKALEAIGYEMKENIDPRNNMGHRWTRGQSHVDVVASGAGDGGDRRPWDEKDQDIVDVVVADHSAPSIEGRMRCMDMVKIAGGTQALKRTSNYRLKILSAETTTISVPRYLGRSARSS